MKRQTYNSKLSTRLRQTAAALMEESLRTQREDLLEASVEMVTAANKLR